MDYAIYKERDGKNPHVVHRFTQETCNHKAKLAAREKLSEMWMRVLQRPYLCHNPKMEPGKIDGFRYDYMTSVNTSLKAFASTLQNSNLKINNRMKKYIILIALSVAALTACTSTKLASVSDNERGEISWNAFCEARGYDRNDNTYLTMNEYLDTWCGSVEEEDAFIKAGVEPY